MTLKRTISYKPGEDYLGSVEALVVRLEDGSTHSFSMAGELCVPDDPRELLREAKRAPARLAFWAYQMERALMELRASEREFDRKRGEEYLIQRRYLAEHAGAEIPTEANVKARVDMSRELDSPKKRLADAQKSYGVLRALKDASEHRSHLLRRLVAHEFEER